MYKVEKAIIKDATLIHKLVNSFAERGDMLARPLSEVYENIRDYFVVKQGDKLLACGALHINWSDLAEIKSLAVEENYQKKGLGDLIVVVIVKLGILLVGGAGSNQAVHRCRCRVGRACRSHVAS